MIDYEDRLLRITRVNALTFHSPFISVCFALAFAGPFVAIQLFDPGP